MKLTLKFNLVLIFVFSIGLAITGVLSWKILQDNARKDMIDRAGLMMDAALAVRSSPYALVNPISLNVTVFCPVSG